MRSKEEWMWASRRWIGLLDLTRMTNLEDQILFRQWISWPELASRGKFSVLVSICTSLEISTHFAHAE
jgi:hypothetical protein